MPWRIVPVCFLGACCAAAQTLPNPPAQQNPIIRLTTKEVVLGLVVRDRHGHLVNDLRAGEIQVYEDGVRQKVTSFRNVQGQEQLETEKAAERVEAATAAVTHPLNSLPEVNFVSVVFAPMALNNLAFAREAVTAFLKSEVLPNTYVSLYRLDTRLRLACTYTHDKAALITAVNQLTNSSLARSGRMTPAVITNSSVVAASSSAGIAAAASGPTGNPLGQAPFDPRDASLSRSLGNLDASVALNAALEAETTLENSLRFVESIATGMTIMDQLRDLIVSQARLPGRKVVLYLSDGLQLPMDGARVFNEIVSAANRSGVTFYTVDTRGLGAPNGPNGNPMDASINQLNRTVAESRMQGALTTGTLNGAPQAAFGAASVGDDAQLLAVSNTQLALQELAVRTGGFAVSNTNEIAKPMERVMEDIRTHYELAYAPSSQLYDGHFRKIEVRVDRPKVTLQTRRGYYALPDWNGEPIQPFEMAALTAMNARPAPYDFTYDAALLQFRPRGTAVQCEIAFEVPIAGLKATLDPKTGNTRIAVSLVALIQDGSGGVVRKVSRQLVRAVPNSDVKTIQDEKIDYAEPVELAPGRYTLDTAVVDGEGNKVAAKRLSVFVRAASKLELSSLEVVKRVSPLQGERNPLDPFEMEDRRVTLMLGDDVASGKPVDLYFVVYPAGAGMSDPPKLLVELFKDGKEAARISSDLPKPDSTGAIPMLAELKPPAGHYDIQVTVRQGDLAAEATRALTVH